MQIQTGSSTTTMAFPTLPASPTLTNPDMILPYGEEYDKAYDTSSPGNEWRGPITNDMQFSIGPPMEPLTPTTPIIYGNGTMLSDIGEVTEAESTPGRKLPGPAERRMLKQAQISTSGFRSSPTNGQSALVKRTTKGAVHGRNVSLESTSTITSEPVVDHFKDFDDGISVDDSNFQGDDEESVADSYSEQVFASETQRLANRDIEVEQDEDQNSSAALSRRAEQILLNAKKRLNNMEGNLTRARIHLYKTPSGSLSSIHSSSPLARSTPSPEERRLISHQGVHSSTQHHLLRTPVDSPMASPGHSRVYSENSIQHKARVVPYPARSSSAAARYMNRTAMDGSSPESSQETPRFPALSQPASKTSPPRGHLEPLSEDEIPEFRAESSNSFRSCTEEGYISASGAHRLTRSASSVQMRDLRDQMHDLKGRLSVLRDRARDDTMKRRSLQSLRTPSPFTAAEQWYAQTKSYVGPGLSVDAGVGQNSPIGEGNAGDIGRAIGGENLNSAEPEYASSEATSVYEDVEESSRGIHGPGPHDSGEEAYDTAAEPNLAGDSEDQNNDYNDEMVNKEELDDYESDSSFYHDSLEAPISHEDREDAFDYEHFFLHSAMGTIRQQKTRSGSFSSEDSVETTRGPPVPAKDVEERPSLTHLRSGSNESVSTVATFQTATEGRGSDSGDDERDQFAVQSVGALEARSSTPDTTKRSTFGSPSKTGQSQAEESSRPTSAVYNPNGQNGVQRPSVSSAYSLRSTGSQRSFPLINKPKSQVSLNQNLDSGAIQDSDSPNSVNGQINGERLQSSPVHMLAREDQILVERLVASLGKCVLGLQDASRGSYDGRVLRRRLDFARRTLEGEENVI